VVLPLLSFIYSLNVLFTLLYEENIYLFRLWKNCFTQLKLVMYLLFYVKLVFITVYEFNYNHSFSILLYLIYTDRPFLFAKDVIIHVNVFIKDTIFL